MGKRRYVIRSKYNIQFDFEPSDVFDFAMKNGITGYDDAQNAMTLKKMKELVNEVHPFAVTSDKDGRFSTYVVDETKKNGRKEVKKTTEKALYEYLFAHYGLVDEESAKNTMTLAELYPQWLEYKRLHTTASTYITRIEADWKKYYQNTDIIKIPLCKLDKLTLDEWAHALIKDNEMTKNNYYNVAVIMRQSLNYAVDLGLIESNPFQRVKIDGKRMFRKVVKKPDAEQVFTREESKQMCEMAWDDYRNKVKFYELSPLCMMFQMQTGLRVGEAVAVKFSDIESPNHIHIQRMLRRDTKTVIPHTKTDCGDRYVLLTTTAKELIETARERQKELGGKMEYIFSVTDEPISEYSVQELYRKYCFKLGIWNDGHQKYKNSHAARRTYISALIDEGVNLNTVRQMAGHASEKTTLKNYTFDRATEREKIEKFEAALNF